MNRLLFVAASGRSASIRICFGAALLIVVGGAAVRDSAANLVDIGLTADVTSCSSDNLLIGEDGCGALIGQQVEAVLSIKGDTAEFVGTSDIFGVGTEYEFHAPDASFSVLIPFSDVAGPGPVTMEGESVVLRLSDFGDNTGALIDQTKINGTFVGNQVFVQGGAFEANVQVGEYGDSISEVLSAFIGQSPGQGGGLGGLLGGLLGGSHSTGAPHPLFDSWVFDLLLFGSTTTINTSLTTFDLMVVPEPAAWILALIACIGAGRRRRRSSPQLVSPLETASVPDARIVHAGLTHSWETCSQR